MPTEWIELSDGCRLSARIWLPEGTGPERPVPCILEYLPYRKDDLTAWQDSTRHPYFAEHGFAAARVDLRGTGDSDGVLLDEYLAQEQDDAVEVIAWLASQSWCTGAVGMIGYSWGGFNGLQIAARRPPALKAIVTAYSTDDRYRDDCHYLGGAVLANDMLRWAHTMRAINALPPTPEVAGERWRELWRNRLERTPHFVEAWLTHQTYDEYWKQGSVCEDYQAIEAATLVVGGWADAYTNAVPRLLEHLTCPRAGIIGPWAHVFPERGVPGPAIGFLQECVAWFERWLKDVPADAGRWPLLRAWIQEPLPPKTFYAERPGRWIARDTWPPPDIETRELGFARDGRLLAVAHAEGGAPDADEDGSPGETLDIAGVQSCGEVLGVWCANGLPDELGGDQRVDDARSSVFDSEPLAARLEIFGHPVVMLEIEATAEVGTAVARLCDVAPSGESALLSYGVLNLAHREGHEQPEPLVPGRRYTVRVPLRVMGTAIGPGHKLRLALSPTSWPMVWPQPTTEPLRIVVGGCRLALPVLGCDADAPGLADALTFGPAEYATPLERRGDTERHRAVERLGDESVMREHERVEQSLPGLGVRMREENRGVWRICDDDPLSASCEFVRDYAVERESVRGRVLCRARMSADAEEFHVTERLEVFDDDERIKLVERSYDIPRNLC